MASFGEGFAQGLGSGSNAVMSGLQTADWMKKRREERELADAGKVDQTEGQDVEGTTYKLGDRTQAKKFTDDEVQQERMRRLEGTYARQGNATKVQEIRRGRQQEQATGLQLHAAQRTNDQADLADTTMGFMRRLKAGEDPSMVMHDATRFYNKSVDDGKHTGIGMFEGQPYITLTDSASGQSKFFPLTSDTAQKAIHELYAMTSPQAYSEHQKLGLHEREVKTKEGAEQRQSDFYAPGGVYERTHDKETAAYMKLYGSGNSSRNGFSQAGSLPDKTPVVFNNSTGRYLNGFTGKPLSSEQISLFQKVTGDKSKGGMQPLQGNPGMFTDGTDLFRMDDKTQQLVEVPTPKSMDRIAATLRENLQKRQDAQGLRPRLGLSDVLPDTNRRAGIWREMKHDLTGGNSDYTPSGMP